MKTLPSLHAQSSRRFHRPDNTKHTSPHTYIPKNPNKYFSRRKKETTPVSIISHQNKISGIYVSISEGTCRARENIIAKHIRAYKYM